MVAVNGYNYTHLVEFTSIPADYSPYYPPTRTGGSAGPSMLPTTWAMVTLSTCHVIIVAPPTQPSQRPRRHLPPIMWVTEAPPTLSHAYVVARMRHGSYPLSPNTRPQYGNTGEHCSKPSTHSTKREECSGQETSYYHRQSFTSLPTVACS